MTLELSDEPVVVRAAQFGKTYGYIRVSTDKQAESHEVQRRTIEQAALRLGSQVDGWFQDAPAKNPDGTWNDAQSGKIPLPERKAGRELCGRLRKGDMVIVSKLDRAFRKLSDCVLMLDKWERLGVNVLLCDFPAISDLTNPFGKALLQMVAVFAEVERKLISQRTREALANKKRRRQAVSAYPGYGFKWVGEWSKEEDRRVKVKVRDDAERSIMAQIVKWRLDSYGWDAITSHLNAQKVINKHGKPWSRSRVIRAFHAELKLQAYESRSREP